MYNEIKICLQAYTYVLIPRSTKVLRQRYKHVHRREAFNKWRTIQLVLPGVQGQGQGRAGWVISLPMLSSQSMLTLKAFLAKPIWSSLDAALYVVRSLSVINSDTQQKGPSLKDQFPLVQKVAEGKCVTTCDNWPYQHCKVFIFLAVQDSSKGDIVTQWVWQWVIFSRCRRRMWPFWQRQRY